METSRIVRFITKIDENLLFLLPLRRPWLVAFIHCGDGMEQGQPRPGVTSAVYFWKIYNTNSLMMMAHPKKNHRRNVQHEKCISLALQRTQKKKFVLLHRRCILFPFIPCPRDEQDTFSFIFFPRPPAGSVIPLGTQKVSSSWLASEVWKTGEHPL